MAARKPPARRAAAAIVSAAPRGRTLKVRRLAHAEGLALPAYQTADAAGMDLIAAVAEAAPVTLKPRQRALIPTGLVMALPKGHEAQVRPRSGLALKHGITVLNSPGTIDADYRGEVQVILVNLGDKPFVVARGERIAQLVVQPVTRVAVVATDALGATTRGAGGFGSTGTASRTAPAAQPSGASSPSKKAAKPAKKKPIAKVPRQPKRS